MSVILAILGKGAGVVSSDSRRVESDGTVKDDWDKTFAISSPAMIGTFLGLLEFGGRTVAEHVEEIVATSSAYKTIKEVVELIGNQLRERLVAVPEAEVGFQYRGVELLIVGKTALRSGPLAIHSVELRPDVGKRGIALTCEQFGIYAHSGDSDARARAAKRFEMKAKQFPKMAAASLRIEADKAITTAIAHSGLHPHHLAIKACGGTPRTRTI